MLDTHRRAVAQTPREQAENLDEVKTRARHFGNFVRWAILPLLKTAWKEGLLDDHHSTEQRLAALNAEVHPLTGDDGATDAEISRLDKIERKLDVLAAWAVAGKGGAS